LVLGIDQVGNHGQENFFDFTLQGAFGSEQGSFDQLLGDGGATLEFAFEQGIDAGAQDAFGGDAVMAVEMLVFNGDGSLGNIGRQAGEPDGDAILVGVDGVKEIAVAVKNLGGDREVAGAEFGGRRQVL
jgi:hypothetical protein